MSTRSYGGGLRMGRVVAVLGQKGGTGKTSTVCGLGAAGAEGSWVWIDTPPYHPEISRQALGVADEALIPLCPSGVELAQLRDTLALVAGARPDIAVSIVLVKVKPHT